MLSYGAYMYFGMQLVRSLGFTKIIVEVDSKCVALLCHEDQSRYHPYASLIQGIRSLRNGDILAEVHHIYGEANHCADSLAKHGLHHRANAVDVFSSMPSFISLPL